jgi:alginate O-acetyltransferase complex protein AlgI
LVFSSLLFLLVFLPVFLGIYYASPRSWRNAVAVAGSLLFYAWGAPRFIVALLGSCLVDYVCTRKMGSDPQRTRARIVLAIAFNVSVLVFFKYSNFMVQQCNGLLGSISSGGVIPWKTIALPIGISFFTFQKISYLVDVRRERMEPARTFLDYLLYVCLFPQLIAGPIVRYHDVARQITSRVHSTLLVSDGFRRFVIGLAKKVLIANHVGLIADATFNGSPSHLSCGQAWIGVIAYSFQIYFDFSGYSDMAIGLGRLMGFRFLENFNRPYLAIGFTDFWRRWHISLSNWMREYLYLPLGGNRVSHFVQIRNLWIVFLVSGLWHGASWNFVAWGAYHGLFLSLEKGRRVQSLLTVLPAWVRRSVTFLLISIGWCFFRAGTFEGALAMISRLFTLGPATAAIVPIRSLAYLLSPRIAVALLVAAILSFWPESGRSHRKVVPGSGVWTVDHLFSAAGTIVLLLACVGALTVQDFNPFIYFRF